MGEFSWSHRGSQRTCLDLRQGVNAAWRKVNDHIKQWQLIMIASTAIQKISSKVWTDYFVAVNLHPSHCFSLADYIKNIILAVKTGDTACFRNRDGSY